MKIYNEQFALQSQKPREVLNITTQVKAAVEKSGMRQGLAIVSSLNSNTAIIVNEGSAQIISEIADKLDAFSTLGDPVGRPGTSLGLSEIAGDTQFPAFLISHQTVIPFSDARPDLGNAQAVLFLEFDGLRPRQIVIKIFGE
jgi:secondary thiamine-phosphate synthase enzyme